MKDIQDGYLTGKVLLAMPSMGDPRFARAVIFICVHDEQGAMGLVVNTPAQNVDMKELLRQLKLSENEHTDFEVMSGGPVQPARGFMLHLNDYQHRDTINITTGDFSITGTTDALKDVRNGNGPKDMLFILGYAGWTAGQLEQEIQENSWLVLDADPALIFHENASQKWDMAMAKMGLDPAMLSGDAGRA